MRLLVVEGNTVEGSAAIVSRGGRPYHRRYAAVMELLDKEIEFQFAFPSEEGANALPKGLSFADIDGAVWTGSPLHVYEETQPVINQLKFAEALFSSGTPVFGSCWGLQIMTQALGGRVRKNPHGREVGIAKDIRLNNAGVAHPMFEGKDPCFECFTVHLDEVEDLAPGSIVLAGNDMSDIQAASIEASGGCFWGVQYHPEFNAMDMAMIFERLAEPLVNEGIYQSVTAVNRAGEAIGQGLHAFDRLELRNWLKSLNR